MFVTERSDTPKKKGRWLFPLLDAPEFGLNFEGCVKTAESKINLKDFVSDVQT